MDFNDLFNFYHQRVNLTLTRLLKNLSFQGSPLINAMKHGTLFGGKCFRSFLVYATGIMFNIDPIMLDAPAAAIECMHSYSLIHDDLPAMDNSTIRRGQLACHIKYGETIAILAGDALQTLAFSIISDDKILFTNIKEKYRLDMLAELARASGANGMCIGQALDMSINEKSINLIDLEQIYRYKTGSLIRAAVRLGALSAGKKCCMVLPMLDKYADAIGLAFQIQDDILDICNDTYLVNNKKNSNYNLNKNNYLSIIGLDNARMRVHDLCQEAINVLENITNNSYDITTLKSLVNFIIQRNK